MATTDSTGREITDVEKLQVVIGVLQAAAALTALYLILRKNNGPTPNKP